MKNFALKRLSLATALVCAAGAAFAQVPTNPFSLPKIPSVPTVASTPTIPSLPATSLDIATLAAQQAQIASDIITKAHEQAGNAARAMLGTAADDMNPDELEATLAERIPGFAGWIHREDGTSVMRLAGIKASDAATALSRSPAAAAFAAATGSKVTVQAALFDSRQLLDFKTKAFGLASVQGVVSTWIDRETNRVEVKYSSDLDPAAIDALSNQLVAAGIPRAALVLSPGEVATVASATGVTLANQKLPLAAGSQISAQVGSLADWCTLGVPAVRSGVRGFVTASHCSNNTFGIESPSLFADGANASIIADEKVDPKGTTCPSGITSGATRGCRKSDTLFAAARASNVIDLGKLLVTPGANNLTVSKIVNIIGSQSNNTVGQTVYKTGRTTGTTSAKVARVCVDTLVVDLTKKSYGLQCSTQLDSAAFVDSGDSGSPVWLNSSSGATIVGIVAYKIKDTVVRGFSPWGAVVKDLGSLTIK